jgi:hypothetical protein
MVGHDTLFTPTEAAVLTGLPLKAVHNAIDKKIVSAVPGEGGGRLLDARALLSLSLERRLAERVAPELRRKLFDALAETQPNFVSLEVDARHSSIRNLTTPRWRRGAAGRGGPAADRATVACAAGRATGRPRRRMAPTGSFRPRGGDSLRPVDQFGGLGPLGDQLGDQVHRHPRAPEHWIAA